MMDQMEEDPIQFPSVQNERVALLADDADWDQQEAEEYKLTSSHQHDGPRKGEGELAFLLHRLSSKVHLCYRKFARKRKQWTLFLNQRPLARLHIFLTGAEFLFILLFLSFNIGFICVDKKALQDKRGLAHRLGKLLHWLLALGCMFVTKNSVWKLLLGCSFERAITFHRWTSVWVHISPPPRSISSVG